METALTMETSSISQWKNKSCRDPQNTKNKLTSENLSELGPEKYELEMGHG